MLIGFPQIFVGFKRKQKKKSPYKRFRFLQTGMISRQVQVFQSCTRKLYFVFESKHVGVHVDPFVSMNSCNTGILQKFSYYPQGIIY